MKPLKVTVISTLLFGLPTLVSAQGSADTNGDGVLTIEEVQVVVPDVDSESFAQMDANGDGALDQDEITIAVQAGLLPPSNG
ncbi:hypothetical protein RKLH11_484 [Rhodobacteraceae bacterium KLH11]|nr:hypothetical protein RKLH11_484 [Rhodobacteraceae bacterium KLH11]